MCWAKWKTAFLIGILAFGPALLTAKVIYVDASATDLNDGSSWVNAYRCLQDALTDANTAEKPVEIWVAQGTYQPDRGQGITPGDRKATFRLINEMTLKGGYAGIGNANPETRDPAKYPSVLSGDLNGDDVPVQNADQLLGQATRLDNSRHVVTAGVEDSDQSDSDVGLTADGPIEGGIVIDGFTIAAGQDEIEAYDLESEGGSGILLLSGALTLIDCTVQNNATCNVGGGMYNTAGCQPTLCGCVFARNYAQYGGGTGNGRLYAVSEGCRLTMTDCTFSDNCAFQGAGLFSYGGRTEATGCTFRQNIAAGNDNAAFGGGMYVLGGDLFLTDCSFTGNAAIRAGGAISHAGGDAQLLSCTFSRNTAGVGGGIDMSMCNSLLDGCSFTGNMAPSGGGLHSITGPVTLNHCLFVGNGSCPASKRFSGTHREGGAIYLLGSASLANCTFHGNLAESGPSLWAWQSEVAMTNCILWDGEDQICTDDGNQPIITYSDVLGTWPGLGNIEADPCFAQPGYWDPNGTPDNPRDDFWVDGDYHLKSHAGRWDPNSQSWITDETSSPCIDAGDPNTPVCDEPQPNGGRINMGANGGTAQASESSIRISSSSISGLDADGGRKIGSTGVVILSHKWTKDRNE